MKKNNEKKKNQIFYLSLSLYLFFLRVTSFRKNVMRKSRSISNLEKSFVLLHRWKVEGVKCRSATGEGTFFEKRRARFEILYANGMLLCEFKFWIRRSYNKEHQSCIFQANATLAFLEKITEEEKVARCFSRSPLSLRAAAAVCVPSLSPRVFHFILFPPIA